MVLAAVAAVAAAAARRRLLAVLLAGVTGYGMVALFALAGAPDLALTQLLVETVSLVVFVLVLRRLPRHFEADEPRSRRWPRAVIGVAVGMVMAGLALAVTGARQATPVSVDLPDLAYLEAHGRNVVNVLLVDIRAWDTLGEISVLVAVATGVASLVFVTGRAGRVPTIGGRRRGADHRRAAAIEPVTGAIPTVDPETGRPLTQTRMLRTIDDADAVDDDRTRRSWLLAGRTLASTHRSLLVEVVVRLTFLPFMLIAVMLLIAGHNQPGGGFIAGLVAGLALVLRYLAAGRYELGEALPVPPGLLLGGGSPSRSARGRVAAGRRAVPDVAVVGGARATARRDRPGHADPVRHRRVPRGGRARARRAALARGRSRRAGRRRPGARRCLDGGGPMTVSLALIVLMAVLYAAGAYLLLARSLSRILIGVLLVGNATNLLLLVVAGDPGDARSSPTGSTRPG